VAAAASHQGRAAVRQRKVKVRHKEAKIPKPRFSPFLVQSGVFYSFYLLFFIETVSYFSQ
jgi:hypothetical protein